MTGPSIPDYDAREQCLNITHSYIVQAPAGSGKTELLTQRFLRLLACVTQPEQVVAITFTRKAAGEMRERILNAFNQASIDTAPAEAHARKTWQLAREARQQDERHQWRIAQNPNRLRVLTLDSLALMIASQTPILSGFGAKPDILADARPSYEEAVRQFILSDHDSSVTQAMDNLLLSFNNRAETVSQLLITLLEKREQWLSHLMPYHGDPDALLDQVKQTLEKINETLIQEVIDAFPIEERTAWEKRIEFSLSNRSDENQSVTLDHQLSSREHWVELCDIALTKTGVPRKTLTKKQGFPAASSAPAEEKERFKLAKEEALLALDDLRENANLLLALNTLRHAPSMALSTDDWQSTQEIMILLPWLVAQLNCHFQRVGQVDFNEISLGALRALGNEENPTETAMKLDHQIQHLLLDEFQDTSLLQGELIKQLIREWTPHDGRTVFIVGDPMQSIYRFRNAEVSLFLNAQKHGMGTVDLIPLTLSSNFRSTESIINWINPVFETVFPTTPQPAIGGVPYSHAVAIKACEQRSEAVTILPPCLTQQEEAEQIADTIRAERLIDPKQSIAILVRTRHQLTTLLPYLKQHGIPVMATDIDYLGERPEIRDLLTLTRALLHLGDRTAWLALLRSPCFGFNLSDCLLITKLAGRQPLWEAIKSPEIASQLSTASAKRLEVLRPILNQALKYSRRCPLPMWIHQVWEAIGGYQSLTSERAIAHVQRFIECLSDNPTDFSIESIEQRVAALYSEDASPSDHPIQVMTIHKSKGLEFDCVILPNINYGKPPERGQLISLATPTLANGETGLLLARHNETKVETVARYLQYNQTQRTQQEIARLFYVACTRAKKTLYLSSIQKPDTVARNGSFLKKLPQQTLKAKAERSPEVKNNGLYETQSHQRTVKKTPDSALSMLESRADFTDTSYGNDDIDTTFNPHATLYGTVAHLCLADWIESGQGPWPHSRIANTLILSGYPTQRADTMALRLHEALQSMATNKPAQWVMDHTHIDSQCEFTLIEKTKKGLRKHCIDRTFIDETGTRWIIDFKTSQPIQSDIKAFLRSEVAHYKPQLKRYQKLFQHENRPIKTALYFIMIQTLEIVDLSEWENSKQTSPPHQPKKENTISPEINQIENTDSNC